MNCHVLLNIFSLVLISAVHDQAIAQRATLPHKAYVEHPGSSAFGNYQKINSTAVWGDICVMGDPEAGGKLHTFIYTNDEWSHSGTIEALDNESGLGKVVAIDQQTLFASAPSAESEYPNNPGYYYSSGAILVYSRNGSGWATPQRLLPPPVGTGINDRVYNFGQTMATDGQTLIATGYKSISGTTSKAIYVYTKSGTSWTYEAELLPTNDFQFSNFGISIDVSGNTIVASSRAANGVDTGRVFVFTKTSGTWSQELIIPAPPNALWSSGYGDAVSVYQDTLVVGAPGLVDPLTGRLNGVALIFNKSSQGMFEYKTYLGGYGNPNTTPRFGSAIVLEGNHLIISAPNAVVDGQFKGTVYAFYYNGYRYQRQYEMASHDISLPAAFGSTISLGGDTVAISNSITAQPSPGESGPGMFFFDVDSDNDGLMNSWENIGIPYESQSGQVARYQLPASDPDHKDFYYEVDLMSGISLSSSAIDVAKNVFTKSPLTNPDGVNGVNLHLIIDETTIPHESLIEVASEELHIPLNHETMRTMYFGTPVERSNPNIIAAKMKAVRHLLVLDKAGIQPTDPQNPNPLMLVDTLGIAMTSGDIAYIYRGAFDLLPSYLNVNDRGIGYILVHEIGHNLGLLHGGNQDINGKTNYPSVMNYMYALPFTWAQRFMTEPEFTSVHALELTTLNEASLDETQGLGAGSTVYDKYMAWYGVGHPNDPDGRFIAVGYYNHPLDFGDPMVPNSAQDTFTNGFPVIQDLNYAAVAGPDIDLPNSPSSAQIFYPCHDWNLIDLSLGVTNIQRYSPSTSSPSPSWPDDEVSIADVLWIEANVNPCYPDLNNDGDTNYFDVNIFLAAFNSQSPLGDWNNDGMWNYFDVAAYTADHSQGCP